MPRHSLVVITVEEDPELTLEELCHACNVAPEWIQQVIEYGIIEPRGLSLEAWRFNADHLRRLKIITHLHKDLEVNLPGAALVIDLMEEMEKMRARIELFEKIYR